MKKIRVLVCLSVLLTLGVTACGSAGTSAGGVASSAAVATAPEENGADAVLPDRQMLIGTISESAYTNDFFDLYWTLPSGWAFADRAEVNSVSSFDPEEMVRRINEGEEYLDLCAQDPVTGTNVIVAVQGLSGYGALLSLVDETTLIDETIDAAYGALEARGAQDINAYRDTVSFRGEEVPCLTATCTVNGIEVIQRMIYLMDGEYVAALNVTMIGGDNGAILNAFSRIP